MGLSLVFICVGEGGSGVEDGDDALGMEGGAGEEGLAHLFGGVGREHHAAGVYVAHPLHAAVATDGGIGGHEVVDGHPLRSVYTVHVGGAGRGEGGQQAFSFQFVALYTVRKTVGEDLLHPFVHEGGTTIPHYRELQHYLIGFYEFLLLGGYVDRTISVEFVEIADCDIVALSLQHVDDGFVGCAATPVGMPYHYKCLFHNICDFSLQSNNPTLPMVGGGHLSIHWKYIPAKVMEAGKGWLRDTQKTGAEG